VEVGESEAKVLLFTWHGVDDGPASNVVPHVWCGCGGMSVDPDWSRK